MTKEEKIKEAWGDNYSKDVIMKGIRCGFKIITNLEYISTYKGGDWYCEPHTFETIAFMPTTLRQILKNNGWIKIESEGDLPKETGHFLVCNKINNQIEVDYMDWDYESHIERWMEFNSHYQPIEKPNAPIY